MMRDWRSGPQGNAQVNTPSEGSSGRYMFLLIMLRYGLAVRAGLGSTLVALCTGPHRNISISNTCDVKAGQMVKLQFSMADTRVVICLVFL